MPSSGLLISCAMPGGQAAGGGEPLGVEELALQVAHVRLLAGPRLQPLALRDLAHGEEAEQDGQAHRAQVQGERRAIARGHRLHERVGDVRATARSGGARATALVQPATATSALACSGLIADRGLAARP